MELNAKSRFIFTRLLVCASMGLSILTAVAAPLGIGELYPFATWKLFTQPIGSKNFAKDYRIYTLAPGQKVWQRQTVPKDSEIYTPDEYFYTLNGLAEGALSGKADTAVYRARLRSFAKYVAPGAAAYRIVQETYKPSQLLQHPQHYDTLTVIRF